MKKRIIILSIIFIIMHFFVYVCYAQNESSTDLKILRLDIEGMEPVFQKDVYEYYLIIPTYIENIEITAIPENPQCDVLITGNTNIKEGLNVINIEVILKDKSKKNIYTINVTKTDDKLAANTNLEILAIKDELISPPFDSSITNYKVEISNNITSLNVLAIPENEESKVIIQGKENLKIGSNLITVKLTAPNVFTKKEYKIDVIRRNQQEEIENIQESEKMEEKLENAYKIERTSIVKEQGYKSQNKEDTYIIVGVIIFVITTTIVLLKKKNKNGHK